MSGSVGPMRCCDAECAAANGCTIGGVECDGCGRYFCAEDLDADGLCEDCAKEAEEEEEGDDGEE